MAEAIGVASGLVALSTFAYQSSVVLYTLVASFQAHQPRVRDLAEETHALAEVLKSLVEVARAKPDLQIPALEFPLKRCTKACEEFRDEIKKFSSRSKGAGKTSFRDWARLRYMGEDVDGFRRLLSDYKMTINIALTNATLQQSLITSEAVEGYTELIQAARAALEDRLAMMDVKLEHMLGETLSSSSSIEALDVAQIKEERQSTENSLQICADLSDHINRLQLAQASTQSSQSSSFSNKITNDTLQKCKDNLSSLAEELMTHEKKLFDSLMRKVADTGGSPEALADIARLRDELESARQSANLVSSASRELERSVSIIENHATGDAVQYMVSTNGQVLHGTNRSLGWKSRQVGGYIDSETLRQISKDWSRPALPEVLPNLPDKSSAREDDARFQRFGGGKTLSPKGL